MREILRELAMLAGQTDGQGDPALELQIGDIVSRTTTETIGGAEVLAVTARLPVSERSPYLSETSQSPGEPAATGDALLRWDEKEGRYIVTRRVIAESLRGDRAVMDAILETVDAAVGWHDVLVKLNLQKPTLQDKGVRHERSAH